MENQSSGVSEDNFSPNWDRFTRLREIHEAELFEVEDPREEPLSPDLRLIEAAAKSSSLTDVDAKDAALHAAEIVYTRIEMLEEGDTADLVRALGSEPSILRAIDPELVDWMERESKGGDEK